MQEQGYTPTEELDYLLFCATLRGWTKASITYQSSGLVVASTTGNTLLFTTSASGISFVEVGGVNIAAGSEFSYGKGSAITATIGLTGTQDRFHDSVDMVTAALAGTRPKYGVLVPASTEVRMYFTAGANLDTMTSGAADIYYRSTLMP